MWYVRATKAVRRDVRRVDLATELQILAFHEQRKAQYVMSQTSVG